MSQPFQPAAGGQLPQPNAPPSPFPPIPRKKPWFKRWWAIVLFVVVGLLALSALINPGGTTTTPTAVPAPTVTVTKTVGVGPDETAPTAEPEPEPEPTKAPASWTPKPKDFKVTVKITDKQCFDTAGCLIDYKVGLDYLGTQDLPSEGTTDITYQISGPKDPITETITLNSEGKFDVQEGSCDTSSSSKKLVAKVTEVDYNEFG